MFIVLKIYFRCPPGFIRCKYGACISKSKKCNGISDCIDQSDESQCGKMGIQGISCKYVMLIQF